MAGTELITHGVDLQRTNLHDNTFNSAVSKKPSVESLCEEIHLTYQYPNENISKEPGKRYFDLGITAAKEHQFAIATLQFSNAINVWKTSSAHPLKIAHAHYHKAHMLLLDKGNYLDAFFEFKEVRKIYTNNSQLPKRAEECKKMISALRIIATTKYPIQLGRKYYALGIAAAKEEKYTTAIHKFSKAINVWKGSSAHPLEIANGHYHKAHMLLLEKRYADAFFEFRNAERVYTIEAPFPLRAKECNKMLSALNTILITTERNINGNVSTTN